MRSRRKGEKGERGERECGKEWRERGRGNRIRRGGKGDWGGSLVGRDA